MSLAPQEQPSQLPVEAALSPNLVEVHSDLSLAPSILERIGDAERLAANRTAKIAQAADNDHPYAYWQAAVAEDRSAATDLTHKAKTRFMIEQEEQGLPVNAPTHAAVKLIGETVFGLVRPAGEMSILPAAPAQSERAGRTTIDGETVGVPDDETAVLRLPRDESGRPDNWQSSWHRGTRQAQAALSTTVENLQTEKASDITRAATEVALRQPIMQEINPTAVLQEAARLLRLAGQYELRAEASTDDAGYVQNFKTMNNLRRQAGEILRQGAYAIYTTKASDELLARVVGGLREL